MDALAEPEAVEVSGSLPPITPQVTRIAEDPRAPEFLVIEVDGARFARLSRSAVKRLQLAEGAALAADRLEEVQRSADVEAAHEVAVRLLALRPRSVADLLRRLRERGHNPSVAAEAVGRLEAAGLLDDREFAAHFVRVRLGKGHGARRLVTDLLQHGVDRRVAERAVNGVLAAEAVDPLETARALARKRLRQLGGLPVPTLRRRVLSFLARRGHSGYEVTALVDELLGASEPDLGDGGQETGG